MKSCAFFGVLRWKSGVFLVFSGGLGEVGGGARIIDIPKENLGFGAGTASFSLPHSLFQGKMR